MKPRRQLVAEGITDPDADEYLQSLCGDHHRRKTASERTSGPGWMDVG